MYYGTAFIHSNNVVISIIDLLTTFTWKRQSIQIMCLSITLNSIFSDEGQNINQNYTTFIIACSWKDIITFLLCIKPTYIYIEDCKMTIYCGNHLVLIWGILLDFHFQLSQCNIRHREWLCTNAWMLLLSLLVHIYDTFTL